MATSGRVNPARTEPSVKTTHSEHAQCWRNNEETGFLEPVWPRPPPDECAVLEVACAYLPSNYNADISNIRVSQGAFHKLYIIPSRTMSKRYLLRVAIPVEPFYKTESEVATMAYLRERTTIPIPGVVAWSSSAGDSALGFEWILMEMVNGVTLEQVWKAMEFDDKMKLTKEFAHYMKQLLGLRFTLFGNIYFADKWNEVGYPSVSLFRSLQPAPPLDRTDVNIGKDGKFVIGRMVSTRFFRDKSALLRADRGPYDTARELAVAETKLLGQRIRHLSHKPGAPYYCDVDKQLYKDKTEMLQVFDKLDKIIPHIFSDSDETEDLKVLWHGDLSRLNILVDPITFQIKGIVDWESASIVPAWEVNNGVPRFLQGAEVEEPPPLGSLPEEDEVDLVEIRKDWDLGLLRKAYTEIVGPLFDTTAVPGRRLRRKRKLSTSLATFEDVWRRTKTWLEITAEDSSPEEISPEGFVKVENPTR